MNKIELTIGQATKVLWSFIWRAWVFMLPMFFVMMLLTRSLIPFQKPGEAPQPPDIQHIPFFMGIWLVLMAATLFSQVLALRWALKTKWSDFSLAVVSEVSKNDA